MRFDVSSSGTAVMLLLVACASGTDDPKTTTRTTIGDAATEDAIHGGAATLSDCELETVVEHLLKTENDVTDCGTLHVEATPEVVFAANECAATAHSANRPFTLTVFDPGTDSIIASTFVGSNAGVRYGVLRVHYDSVGFEPNGATTGWFACAEFSVATECFLSQGPYSRTDPCISCTVDRSEICECSPSDHRIACGASEE